MCCGAKPTKAELIAQLAELKELKKAKEEYPQRNHIVFHEVIPYEEIGFRLELNKPYKMIDEDKNYLYIEEDGKTFVIQKSLIDHHNISLK